MSLRELVEATIRGQPQQFEERCDVPAILSAIDSYGISDIDGLLAVLNDNEQKVDLRAAIGTAAPPALLLFVKNRAAHLASATPQPEASAPAMPTTPAAAGFQTPQATAPPAMASPPPCSLVVTVKVGVKELVNARLIAVPPPTTFAELLALAVSGLDSSERSKLDGVGVRRVRFGGRLRFAGLGSLLAAQYVFSAASWLYSCVQLELHALIEPRMVVVVVLSREI